MDDNLINKFLEDLGDAVRAFIVGPMKLARPATPLAEFMRARAKSVKMARAADKVTAGVKAVSKKPRKKGPIQLCPVPKCKNRAAPVFGMVCSKHSDVPKAKIKAFREARRATSMKLSMNSLYGKLGAKGKKPATKSKAKAKTKKS